MDPGPKKRSFQALLEAVEEVRRTGSWRDQEETKDAPAAARPAEMAGPAREPQVGECLGDFRLIREVGRGGMGVVYEAEQQSLRRRVALKVLYPGLTSSARTLQRFLREAEAVAGLHHPNIIPVYAIGEQNGVYFFAMRFLRGPDLAQVIQQLREAKLHNRATVVVNLLGSSDPETATPVDDPQAEAQGNLRLHLRNYVFEAIERVAEVAEALEMAHRRGVIHRDIKPSNLMFDRQGKLMITDFGIAKTKAEITITRTGEFVGSPGYLSPEQALAKRMKVDHRTDVYSLGVTLYEFLTLKQPFLENTLEATLRAILMREPPPLRKLNPRLPKDVDTVVLKAMEKDPDRRFQSAGAFAAELRRILNFEAITVAPAGALTRARRVLRRHRALVVGGAFAAVIAGAFLIGSWLLERQQRRIDERGQSALEAENVTPEERVLIEFITGGAEIDEEMVLATVEELQQKVQTGDLQEVAQTLANTDRRWQLGAQRSDPAKAKYMLAMAQVKLALIRRAGQRLAAGVAPAEAVVLQDILGGFLNDADPLVMKNAAVALGRSGGSQAVAALVKAIYLWEEAPEGQRRTRDPRPEYLEALGALRDPASFGDLQALCRHPLEELRREALWALQDNPHPQVVELLEEVAAAEKDPVVQRVAEAVLARRRPR